MAIATTNPATGEVVQTFDALTEAELDDRLARAAAAFASLPPTTFASAPAWMRAAADLLDAETDETAALMTLEMGKTVKAAKAEIGKCAAACRYYAEHAESMLAGRRRRSTRQRSRPCGPYVRWQPIGPVLAVMPWNFPLWQAMRFAAPALMAGNVGLLKHASNVPQTALYMEDLFRRAGFPDDVFQTLLIGSADVEKVLRDRRVVAATLTGSTPAGKSVAATAGDALKKTVLELGGSDPFVVMPSADLEQGRAGRRDRPLPEQRPVVHRRQALHRPRGRRRPSSSGCSPTPCALSRSATRPTTRPTSGRSRPSRAAPTSRSWSRTPSTRARPSSSAASGWTGPGWYYPPTLLTGVTPAMRMFREEVFGPVAQLHRVPDLDAALELANDTDFGLGSNAWTDDPAEQERFAVELQAGMVFINGMTASYPELPFGGVRDSGYGRELSDLGIKEFCTAKTVWVGESGAGDTSTARPE